MARKSNLNASRQVPNTLVQGNIDTLTQGVSQQPAHLRQTGQGEQQINGWSSPVNGLQKRRPTRFVNKLSSEVLEDFYLETMPVRNAERYQVFIYKTATDKVRLSIISNGVPVKIDLHGQGLTLVNGEVEGDSTSYLYKNLDLAHSYVFINNGPLGLLLNRFHDVKLDSDLSPSQRNEALIFVQSVAYEIEYTVTLNGADLPSYTTPKATDTNNTLSVNKVAQELKDRIEAVSGFRATYINGVLWVRRDDGAAFSLGFSDSRSNTLARSFKGSTTSFAGLPLTAPNGFILKIEGSPDSTLDDYWVRFKTRDGKNFGEGTWVETVAPDIKYGLNVNTMPLVIYRAAPDSFFVGTANGELRSGVFNGVSRQFRFPEWGKREAGDETTVPTPSFVDRPIKDHAIFRGRYVVISGENIVMSRVDEIFNFFMQTSTQVLDTDPIDLTAFSESSSSLQWMLPIDESLLVFGVRSQFQVRPVNTDVLTPRNASCNRLSNIDANIQLRPKLCGANIVFATNEHGFTGFREYQFYDEQSRRIGLNVGTNSSITLAVPSLVPGSAEAWDVGESEDYFVCFTPDRENSLFVYKYLWANTASQITKLQSSWSEWTFDGRVRWVRFMDGDLYIVMTYPDGTYTVKLTTSEGVVEDEPIYCLDRKLRYPECNQDALTGNNITATWDSSTDITTFTLPYSMAGITYAIVRWDNSRKRHLRIATASNGKNLICTENGDFRDDKLVFGRSYKFLYEFSTPYKPTTDQARQRTIGDLSGRLQLATFTVHHTSTAAYDVIVKRKNRKLDSKHEFWSSILNVENNNLDSDRVLLTQGSFRVPVYSRNTDCRILIESASWLPLTLSGASWEGTYSDRARSLN
jgi:hypothetical protein